MLVLAAALVIEVVADTNDLVTESIALGNGIKAYESYYNASEALAGEIEDHNESLFDSDEASNHYNAKSKLNSDEASNHYNAKSKLSNNK